MEKIETYKTVRNWSELIGIEDEFSTSKEEWVFRGETKRRTPKTTLQRICEEFHFGPEDVPGLEGKLIVDFIRNYPIHSPAVVVPDDDDTIFWLSLMRHYGTPTRLLDFTYSFFIATFFATEKSSESAAPNLEPDGSLPPQEPSAVWAVNKSWLTRHSSVLMNDIGGIELCTDWGNRKGSAFRTIFWNQNPAIKAVFPVNPYTFHERLHLQQGLFLCPGSLSLSFEGNLLSLRDYRENVRLILLESSCRIEILSKLHRAGLNRELLFPGMDGFAKSLGTTTPLSFRDQKRLSESGGRVPTDSNGKFLWKEYLERMRKSGDGRPGGLQ